MRKFVLATPPTLRASLQDNKRNGASATTIRNTGGTLLSGRYPTENWIITAKASGAASFLAVAKEVMVVYRITPSIATGVEARKAISRFNWVETLDPVKADAILVVVKTFGLHFPLKRSYGSLQELERDAESQMNITGEIVHLYLFAASLGTIREIAHMSYDE